ncbi:chloramphenicol acetyltransferase (plasmid) [Paracoccus liaowanqingii]|uniref:Chloramphenicol acetyltransferase n=1 Tax=Paracoccus liaowanqingii TaxID=2560053 RepID=A0A4Y5SS23_9RHOB|nr:chloramphenicol acetyltransferase [Paracoccus liaowanqingii]QDA36277.1 chloramphenicol acetyltransferase [Paracoccus liaowanqingii]
MSLLSAVEPTFHLGVTSLNSTYGAYCEIGQGSRILNSSFGDYAYCDQLADIANTSVGKFSNIAAMTRIGPTDHPFTRAAQHHFLYRSASYWEDVENDQDFFAARVARRTVLGPDCWIGHGAIIKPEVTIGAGAIVGAGAVVTKDVAPFAVVGGVSASLIRYRFEPEIIDGLLALCWWDWSHSKLQEALPDFRAMPAEAFIEKYHRPKVRS